MKCLICNEFRGNKVGVICCSGRTVCMKCIPELVDSYITLREKNWIMREEQ